MNNKEYQHSFQIVKDVQGQIREIVAGRMRNAVTDMIQDLFEEELLELCGQRYGRDRDKTHYRAGSDKGSILAHGQRVSIRKPRVKKAGKDVELQVYSALQNYDILCDQVLGHAMAGVSTRNYEPLLDEISGSTGLKKSSVSKAFIRASKGALDEINTRDLSAHDFVSVMVDGVGFGDRTVVVALGVTLEGQKLMLGLREGDTENWELCRDLFENLIERGLRVDKPYLFVIDGSKALRKAIKKVFSSKAAVQRCVRHKERNIIKYLPKERHIEFRRRWKKLHGFNDYQAAKREYADLVHWLGHINHAALESLEEAGMETLTVIKFKVPPLLRKSLASTNPIESAFSVSKRKVKRVKNWRSGANQVARWAATSLLEAEKQFRTIKGYQQLPLLVEELKKLSIEKQEGVA